MSQLSQNMDLNTNFLHFSVLIEILWNPVLNYVNLTSDITPCNPLKVNGHFEATYYLHLQGRRESQERNQYEALLALITL
jgi:hypothetical protein